MPGLAALLAIALAAEAGNPLAGVELAELTYRQRVVVRVQTIAPAAPAGLPRWREKRGPNCVPMAALAGAAVIAPGSVDLMLRTGERVRARFRASCPSLDYYRGFYIAPTRDGRVCADRDAIRDRAGGECEIARFRILAPAH